jgi:hypothetical protein
MGNPCIKFDSNMYQKCHLVKAALCLEGILVCVCFHLKTVRPLPARSAGVDAITHSSIHALARPKKTTNRTFSTVKSAK